MRIVLFVCLVISVMFGQNSMPKGDISGKVVDKNNKENLVGVNVYIKDKNIGASTNQNGEFIIKNLPVGQYEIVYSFIGYQKRIITNVIVRSGRITNLNIELSSTELKMEQVVVSSGYFSNLDEKPVSSIQFNNEEIRRAPGAAGDISRILTSLPSIGKINDQVNSMVVRGGSSVENTFILDNIEIPNINHFPIQGTSGGGLALLNVDFINNLTFNAGGFNSSFGDKLSSVMEISFRDGDKNNFYPQFNFSMMGIGFSAEGPIAKNKASFLFAANKSYTDLILDAANTEGAIPNYYDFQGKISWEIDDHNKISFVNVFANDKIKLDYEKMIDEEENMFGNTNSITNSAGLNWRLIWGKSGYSNTSIAHNFIKYDWDYYFTKDKSLQFRNSNIENVISIRNRNFFNVSDRFKLEFGIDGKILLNEYDFHFGATSDQFGNYIPENMKKESLNEFKTGAFLTSVIKLSDKITIQPGIRTDYFSYNESFTIDPRLSLNYSISPDSKISLSGGIYHQTIPSNILIQNKEFSKLKTPYAIHYIMSYNKLLAEDIRLTIELYDKEYHNFPVDPTQSNIFLFDEASGQGFFQSHDKLKDNGRAYARGVELTLQKKIKSGFYGLISAAYTKTKYKTEDGEWKNRIYDNELMFSVEAGYKPNNSWEFSTKWLFAGGVPYTPFDEVKSVLANSGILDQSKINKERLPAYHSLNFRIDKRFNFSNSNLVIFLDVWNIYGRENISGYVWSEITNKSKKIKQWSTLPVLGIEWEM